MKGTIQAGGAHHWRLAFLPTFMLLGIVLPLLFLAYVEQYLYYLRPTELIPTYGTLWLLLGAVMIPVSILSGLALSVRGRSPLLGYLRTGICIAVMGLAAAALMGALTYSFVAWLQTFGFFQQIQFKRDVIAIGSTSCGLLIALVHPARLAVIRLYPLAKYAAAVGALSLLSLPFFGWDADIPPVPLKAVSPSAPLARTPPHILLVTVDALSAQHMSLYGAARDTTPSLEGFARGATTFDRAYANANFTTPGIASILTATRPWTHRSLQLPASPLADARRNSLPAVLSQAGYQTGYVGTSVWAGAGKNGLGSYFVYGNSDRVPEGFGCQDRLAAVLRYACATGEFPPWFLATWLWQRASRPFSDLHAPGNRHHDPQAALRPALEWLERVDKRRPVLLWVHLLPPHCPYAAPEPWLGQFDSSDVARARRDSTPDSEFLFRRVPAEQVHTFAARYDESVKYVDHYVGEFLQHSLQILGPNTAVVITADHGESFSHGYGMHSGPGLMEEIIHIPLLIKFPLQSRGSRTSVPAEQIDIAPTLADLAGISPPSYWEGRSLVPLVRSPQGETPLAVRPVYAMNFEQNPRRAALTTGSIAVVDGRWKLVHYMGALHFPMMPRLHDELYDVVLDPGELTDRSASEPVVAARLRGLITAELTKHSGAVP